MFFKLLNDSVTVAWMQILLYNIFSWVTLLKHTKWMLPIRLFKIANTENCSMQKLASKSILLKMFDFYVKKLMHFQFSITFEQRKVIMNARIYSQLFFHFGLIWIFHSLKLNSHINSKYELFIKIISTLFGSCLQREFLNDPPA